MTQRQWLLLALIVILAVVAIAVDITNRAVALNLGPINLAREIKVYEGLDLRGGLQVLLQADLPGGKAPDRDQMEAARQIVENRVNGLGVSEPLVQLQGTDKIVVELPGITDPEQAIKTFGQTGLLEFVDAGDQTLLPGDKITTTYPILYEEYSKTPTPTPAPGLTPGAATPSATATQPVTGTGAITGTGTITGTGAVTATAGTEATPVPPRLQQKYPTVITGQDLQNASVAFDQTTGAPEIAFQIKGSCSPQPCTAGSKRFFDYTSKNIGKTLAIVLDKTVISAPRVQSGISDQGRITGQFSLQEAQSLVLQLKYGALPVPLKVAQNSSVGPTLGEDSVQRSVRAGLIGLGIVILFMLIYYRLPGLLADFALVIYAAVVLAVFKMLPVVLTLAGIAGFILSIGMAVDANILIFERTKEELRAGKRLRAAIEAGFSRAWPSIRDSNMSTLITCAILFWFGSEFGASIEKGFALTLAIGVIISLFTAITVTRSFLRLTQRIMFRESEETDESRQRALFGY